MVKHLDYKKHFINNIKQNNKTNRNVYKLED